jgi:Ran GTPase-activating protein (RanGAP) involved in mRNA processing and transport
MQGLAVLLKRNRVLTYLNLFCNWLYDEDACILADGLEGCTTLTFLDLYYNQIGDVGAAALARALPSMTGLTFLQLEYNEVGCEGKALLLAAAGPNLERVTCERI